MKKSLCTDLLSSWEYAIFGLGDSGRAFQLQLAQELQFASTVSEQRVSRLLKGVRTACTRQMLAYTCCSSSFPRYVKPRFEAILPKKNMSNLRPRRFAFAGEYCKEHYPKLHTALVQIRLMLLCCFLGNSLHGIFCPGYVDYNVVAKKLDRRLAGLGAGQMVPRGLGDDQHTLGYEAALEPWLSALWNHLCLVKPASHP